MLKSINISTKFTILILVICLIAVAAISFFSYDYHLKSNQEKFATSLAVIADNQTAYFNTFFERAERAILFIQNSDKVKNESGSGGSNISDGGMDFSMPSMDEPADALSDSTIETSPAQTLKDYLIELKSVLQVAEITITSPTGAVSVSTDPAAKANVVDPDGVTFDRAKNGLYFAPIQRDRNKKNYFTTVSGSFSDNGGVQHLIHIKLDLTPAYRILQNYYGLGETGEVILARQDVISKKLAIVSPLRHDTAAAIQIHDPRDQVLRVVLQIPGDILPLAPAIQRRTNVRIGAPNTGNAMARMTAIALDRLCASIRIAAFHDHGGLILIRVHGAAHQEEAYQ